MLRIHLFGIIFLSLVICSKAHAGDPIFTAAFSPSTIAPEVTSTLTFTIDNSSNDTSLGEVAFSATLPSGVVIATAPNATTDCLFAQYTATGGADAISFSGARISTSESCTFVLNVTSSAAGTHSLTTGALSSNAGTHTTASADLTVSASLPSFTMAASPGTVAPNGVTTLTYTIDNSLNGSNATFIDFSDYLPSGFEVASTTNLIYDCPLRTISTFVLGSITVSSSGRNITVNDVELNAGASCTIQWDVVAPPNVGVYTFQTRDLTSSAGTSGPASTQLTVESSVSSGSVLAMSLPQQVAPGETVILDFSIVNADRDNEISGLNFTVDLNDALAGFSALSLPSTGFCGEGAIISGSTNLSISNVSLAPEASCDFSVTVLIPANAAAGDYAVGSSIINMTRGIATTATAASAQLRVRKAPLLSMEFLSSSASPQEDVSLRITISNTDTVNSASNINFSVLTADVIPGFIVTTFPSANYCGSGSSMTTTTEGATVTGFTVLAAQVGAGASCTFDVVLTVPDTVQPGSYEFSTSDGSASVNSLNLGLTNVSASFSVASAPTLSFSVSEISVVPGGTVTLNFALDYSESATAEATGVGFTVDLDSALTGLSATNLPSDDFCGEGASVTGSSSLVFSGMSLSAGERCEFNVSALVPSGASPGTVTLTTSSISANVSSSAVTSGAISGDFIVSGLVLSHQFLTNPTLPGSNTVVRYTLSNDSNAPAATSIAFTHTLSNIVSSLTATGVLPSTPCGGSSNISGTTNLMLTGAELLPGNSCSFDVSLAVPSGATDGLYTSVTSAPSATVNSSSVGFSASLSTLEIETLTVLLSTSEDSPTSLTSIPLAITFSRDVTNFDVSDLVVSNGSVNNFSGDGSEYSAIIVPTVSGNVTVDLPANVVDDAVDSSVKNPAASQLSIEFDATPVVATPSVVIGSPSATQTNTGPITYGITYTNIDEVNLSTASLELNTTGTATGELSVADGTTSTPVVSVSNITGDGTIAITVIGGASRNGAKTDSGAGPSETFSIDNTSPTVSIVDFVTNPFNADFTVTITFSEDVTGFTVSDLSFSNATLSNFSATSASVYTVSVSPIADGEVVGNLAADSAQDAAGNGNTAAPGFAMIFDTTAPVPVVSSSNTSVNGPFSATFTFQEAVSGFTVDDIAVTNGSVGNFNAVSSTTYSATITPDSEGTISINVGADAATDVAGNASTSAVQYEVEYDVTAPSLTLSTAENLIQKSALVTFTFNEDVSGFSAADILVGNGSVSNFSSQSDAVYTAVVSSTNDGTITIDVAANIAQDAAGNNNTAATQLIISADATAPTLSNTLPADNDSGIATNSHLVLTFSENVALDTSSTGNLEVMELSESGSLEQTLRFEVVSSVLSGPGTVSINDNILDIELDNDMSAGTYYAVQISDDLLQDVAGNHYTGIADNTVFNFTTRPAVVLSSNQVTLTEETSEQAMVSVALINSLNQPFNAPQDVTVLFSFSGSQAVASSDYTIEGLTGDGITIATGASSNSFTVTAINDSVDDDNETLQIAVDSISTNNADVVEEQVITIEIVENSVPNMTGVPSTFTLSEDVKGRLDFSDTSITDEENDSLTLTFSVDTGRIVSPKGTTGNVTVTPITAKSVRLNGLATALNSYLDSPEAIAIVPPKNHNSSMTLSLVLEDGTEQAEAQVVPITITPVNDHPRLTNGSIAEFEMSGGTLHSGLVYSETHVDRTMTVTLDAGNLNNLDLNTLGGSTDEALYSDSEASTNLVTVSFDQKVNLESLVYFFNVGSAPESITFTPTGARGQAVTITSSDFTVDEAGILVNLTGWLGITSFSITSNSGAFAPGLDTIVYSLPPENFSFREEQTDYLDFSSLSLTDDDSDSAIVSISVDSGTLSLPAGRTSNNVSSLTNTLSISIENNVIQIAGSVTQINNYLANATSIQYTPGADVDGVNAASVYVSVDDEDGSGQVELQSISIDISSVNDAPVVSNLNGDTISFIQAGGAVNIDLEGDAIATDVDNDNFDGGSLIVAITAGGNSAEDLLSVDDSIFLSSLNSGATVSVSDTVIGTLEYAIGEGNDFVVNFNSEATATRVSKLINGITFENTNENSPATGNRTLSITLNDGDDDSVAVEVTVGITTLDEDTKVEWISIDTNFTPLNSSSSNAVNHYVLMLEDTGGDGIDTVITSISFSLGGTIDFTNLTYLLEYIPINSVTSDNPAGVPETQAGVYNNGKVTFSNTIQIDNNSRYSSLSLQIYLNETTDLIDHSTLNVSLDTTQDIQVSEVSSRIGTTGILSTSDLPLQLEITATQLVYTTEPAGSISGFALSTQPEVEAQDDFGNLDSDFVGTIQLQEHSQGRLVNYSKTAVGGVVSFSNVTYYASVDNEGFWLQASVSGGSSISDVTSNLVNSDVIATRIRFATQPSPTTINAKTDVLFTTEPVLHAEDVHGVTDTDFASSVVLSTINGVGSAIMTALADSDISTSTVTKSFSSGVANFEGLSINYQTTGVGNESFNLHASTNGLAPATSVAISVNDLPTIAGLPSEIVVVEDEVSALDLSGIELSDTDGNELILTLSVGTGQLVVANGNGVSNNVTITGSGTAILQLQGTVIDLLSLLSSASEVYYISALNDDTDATLTILANDGDADSAASSVSLSISAVNDAPTILGGVDTTINQDESFELTVSAYDVDGDNLTFGVQNLPGWATFDTQLGRLNGQPTNSDVGTYSDIVITVSDGALTANTESFELSVLNVNDPPVISGTPATVVTEGILYSFVPISNDPDGDALSFSIINLPTWASFNEETGEISGLPGDNDVGIFAGIAISVSDGILSVTLDSFSIQVLAVNDAPVISGVPDTTVIQGEQYIFTPDVQDVDSENLMFSIDNQPFWTSFDILSGTLSGTPTANDIGEYSDIRINVSDGEFTVSLPVFSINVVSSNSAPVISGQPASVITAGNAYQFLPVATDVDGDVLIFNIDGLPSWASFDSDTGALSGTPSEADIGTYPAIEISVSDGQFSASLDAFDIVVLTGNTIPVVSPQQVSTNEDTNIQIQLVGNDADGNELTYRIEQSTVFGILELTDDIVSYTPNHDISEVQDQFSFIANDGISDSESATVTITIVPVNDAPEIAGTPVKQIKVEKSYQFVPVVTDIDSDEFTFTVTNRPDWAQFDQSTGQLIGTPQSGDAGTYSSILISVSDGELEARLSEFDIVVVNNSTPDLSGSPDVVAQTGANYMFQPVAIDRDADHLTFTVTNLPSWAQFDANSGLLSGIPDAAHIGMFDNITISVTDGVNTASLPTFSIRVCDICDNSPPSITGTPEASVFANATYQFMPNAVDIDQDELQFSIKNAPPWATFSVDSGRLEGVPEESDVGLYSNIIIRVSDGVDTVAMSAFTIEVLSANSIPVISGNPPLTVFKGEVYEFTPTVVDVDDDQLTFSIQNKPNWTSFNPKTGKLRGTPQGTNVGLYSNIKISVADSINGSVSLPPFNVEVIDKNSAPTISGTPKTRITVDKRYSFSPSSSDIDGDPLSFSVLSLPQWLSFNSDTGALQGTPTTNEIGIYESIEIRVSDGTEEVALSSFDITVTAENIAPIANNSNVSLQEDKSIDIIAVVTDENQDELTISVLSGPSNGDLTSTEFGWSYVPFEDFNGSDSFTYIASDGELESDVGRVDISVSAINDHPIAVNDDIVLDQVESGVYSLNVLRNDIDVDIATNGDEISLQRVSSSYGTALIVDDQIHLEAGASFIGDIKLTYSIRDTLARNSTAHVNLTIVGVAEVNAPTIELPDNIEINATGLLTKVTPGIASAFDAEGRQLPVTLLSETLNLTPGLHKLYWQAEDSFGSTTTAIQEVRIHPILSVVAAESVAEGTDVEFRFLLNGEAPAYPYVVGYAIDGTAENGGIDHTGQSGNMVFTDGQDVVLKFSVLEDGEIEGDESIVLTLDDGLNVGARGTATVIITEENIAPEISLFLQQEGVVTSVIAQNFGNAVVATQVYEPNPQDSLSYEWTSDTLSNVSSDETFFEFNPSQVDAGLHTVSLYVYDDGEPILDANETLLIEVVVSLDTLSDSEDADGDLIPDAQEGYQDSDGDGIPDYLDAIDECNVIAAMAENQNEFLVESDPTACMRLGEIASQNESNGVQLLLDQPQERKSRINLFGERVVLLAPELPEDIGYENDGGIFDFISYDMSVVGGSSRVVLPQTNAIMDSASFRKYNLKTLRWSSFLTDDVNKVSSSPGAQGNCPPPGDKGWQPGVTAGHWCVQLRIEDGGPNDADGFVNGSVSLTGGVSVFVSDNQNPVAQSDSVNIQWNSETDIAVLDNDSDPDGDELTVTNASANTGSVEIIDERIIRYTALSGYYGKDTVNYAISDNAGGRANAKALIQINGNRAPGAVDDFAETDSATAIEIDVIANDNDIDGDQMLIVAVQAEVGMVSISENNTLIYTPRLNFTGEDSVIYSVIDSAGASDSAIVHILVSGNSAPIANNDIAMTDYETATILNVLDNDEDLDGDTLFIVFANADRGTVIVNNDSSLTYSPPQGFSGIDTVLYGISDGQQEATGIVTITVAEDTIETVKVESKSGGSSTPLSLLLLSFAMLLRANTYRKLRR